jgi:Mycothiol maleylpyruvate isomerase N-terminal domain
MTDSNVRPAYLSAAATALVLLGESALSAAWDAPTAVSGFTLGALAGHLARGGIWAVEEYLDGAAPGPEVELWDAATYYAFIPLESDSPIWGAVRDRAQELAKLGGSAVVEQAGGALERLGERITKAAPDATIAVIEGIPMLLDEFLRTRLVELLVHSDDLAVSLGIATPTFSADAVAVVTHLATDIARRRAGDLAVLRAQFRPERQPSPVLRAL